MIDTNESRHRHRSAITEGVAVVAHSRGRVYRGFIYTCPRCGFVARPMKHRIGAVHRGDKHALACPNYEHECEPFEQLALA